MQVELRNSAIKTLEKIEKENKIVCAQIRTFLRELSQIKTLLPCQMPKN